MSDQITTFYIQSYATNVMLLSQQKGSRFESAVSQGTYKGKAASPVEQIGPTAAKKRNTRADPVQFANTPTDRPWVYPQDYDWYDLIDNIDKLRMVVDPQSSFVQNAVNALNRSKDDEIISSFFATRNTGETGATQTAPLSANQISVNTGGTSSGMNVAKLRAGKKLLMSYDIDLDSEEIYCGLTANEHDGLLNEIQVVSTDFNEKPVLVEGKVTRFLGINFIHSERLPLNGSSQRRCPLWVKSGVHLGTWEAIKTDISERPDLRGKPTQIGAMGTFGATRLEEKKVVELVCA